ncbi:GGDEF domain-containing protein [Montanilutibacter psychrotolerans]|uniref:GGDEF domain-containing protein n=1 Tax=Montanilutibacter psychrotolerans TaxID=1327343 RepID=UPI001CC1CA23|nr:GGDEF domain-containing protein [Lysobacter psychrotolerans]
MRSLIPKDDRQLATRLKRQVMGLVSYLMFMAPLVYSVENGWVGFGYVGLAWFLGVAVTINVLFFVAIRGGFSRRFADPSMVVLQVGLAALLALVMAYYAKEATVITTALFFTAFFFGIFSFTRVQYLALTAAVVLGYALMLVIKYDPSQRGSDAFRLELLYFVVLVMVLLWLSILGSYVVQLRASLARRSADLATALARLKELASRDELTGLYNRRHLMDTLEQQQDRAVRYDEPFALCILDIDHFKRVNDSYGHGVGDEALRAVGECVRSHLRRMDVIGRGKSQSTCGRYGGEEFLLVLPHADGADAWVSIERLRTAMHDSPALTSAGPLSITFSAGVAQYRHGESIADMLRRADAAMYRAKSEGRDRVELAE